MAAAAEAARRAEAEARAQAEERAQKAEAEARARVEDLTRQKTAAEVQAQKAADEARTQTEERDRVAAQVNERIRKAEERARKAEDQANARAAELTRQKAAADDALRKASVATAIRTVTPPVATPPAADAPFALVDGTYLTYVRAACGEPFQSAFVKVERNKLTFQHTFRGVQYGWVGTIAADGNIIASVVGSNDNKATGNFAGQRIEIAYPQCGREPIVMQIRWRTQ